MKTTNTRVLFCIAATALLCVTGCTKYYKVTDPSSGKVFYTTDVDQNSRAGYVEFKDTATKSKVTLQSSEVAEISKDQYEAGIGGK